MTNAYFLDSARRSSYIVELKEISITRLKPFYFIQNQFGSFSFLKIIRENIYFHTILTPVKFGDEKVSFRLLKHLFNIFEKAVQPVRPHNGPTGWAIYFPNWSVKLMDQPVHCPC